MGSFKIFLKTDKKAIKQCKKFKKLKVSEKIWRIKPKTYTDTHRHTQTENKGLNSQIIKRTQKKNKKEWKNLGSRPY